MPLKIGGVEVNGPAEEVLVLPRLKGDIVIRARAVLDMKEFDKLCPEPKAKPILKAGQGWVKNTDDPSYKEAMEKYSKARWHYIILKSLEPSEIEWQTVDFGNPDTWGNWADELTDAGLSSVEVNRVQVCVMQANALDERKLEAARNSFLLGLPVEEEKSSGQDTEPQSMPSGEPVNESE